MRISLHTVLEPCISCNEVEKTSMKTEKEVTVMAECLMCAGGIVSPLTTPEGSVRRSAFKRRRSVCR